MSIYLNPEQSENFGLPYSNPHGRKTTINRDALIRANHPEAHTLPGGDLRLKGCRLPGWWTIQTSNAPKL